jgi:hypothetical protein
MATDEKLMSNARVQTAVAFFMSRHLDIDLANRKWP